MSAPSDVDDKTIKAAIVEVVQLLAFIADKYTAAFKEDTGKLNIHGDRSSTSYGKY